MKILYMLYGMAVGGAETFVYNVLSNIPSNLYQIDIAIQDETITNKKLYKLCQEKKSHIYILPKFNKHFLSYLREVNKLMASTNYDIVHIHMNALINIAPVFIALQYGKKVILHSHSTQNNMGGLLGKLVHMGNRKILKRTAIERVACGEAAGHWMFEDKPFTVIDNAISITEYQFNKEERQKVRAELNIADKTVIGHIGRFVEAKNHTFLLEIFSSYVKKHPDTVLVMVGDGELLNNIKKMATDMGIADKTIFTGSAPDTAKYYSAFDCLLFPSKFEGLPFVLVEAQANGLPVIASNQVTEEMNLVDNMHFLSLNASKDIWINTIENTLKPVNRLEYAEKMNTTKYNVENMVKKVEKLYARC